jgi:molybdenum cofactor biosynthesis protein B
MFACRVHFAHRGNGSTLLPTMVHSAKGSKVRVAVLTISDTRTVESDEGGQKLRELFERAGFEVTSQGIVRDEPEQIRSHLLSICDADTADAIVSTGGTGIAPRDQTYEAIDALLEKRIDGFGEAFRRLSWEAIGPRAILSRAVAGTLRGHVVVALPGSPAALALAVEQILVPVLPHAVSLARGGRAQAH